MKKWIMLLMVGLAALAQAVEKPNVVLFFADDFGWGDIACHNDNPKHFRYTPNMDRIFSKGVELRNYMTHCVCSPSRAGLLTGRHYANIGAGPRTGGTLPNNIRNIAKDFQSAGYKTGAFGKWHNSLPNFPEDGNGRRVDFNKEAVFNELHGEMTLNLTNNVFENHKGWKWGEGVNAYGFDRWVGYYAGGGDHFDHYVDWHHDADWWHDRKYAADELGYRTDLITQHAIEFIEKSKDGPFFCYIPEEAVHSSVQLKRSDLKEFCGKLDTELGIKGQWEYVSEVKSPTSGRCVGEVEQLHFEKNSEFYLERIDPSEEHFAHLIYAAYIYTLDKSVGAVLDKIHQLGKTEQTLVVFASDNGATPRGVNLPFQGGKHSLWEGGVHVPAALWWPGIFDAQSESYARKGNDYEGFIAYIDLYPTVMAMTGNSCLAEGIDGINCWDALRNRKECRPDAISDAIHWMWVYEGSVRTRQWKLLYSESRNRQELYDMKADITEATDLASAKPEVCKELVDNYRNWIKDNNYAMSWMTIDKDNISHPDPAPDGEVLEVRATQTQSIRNPDRDGVFVRFSNGGPWEEEYDTYVHAGDRVEFDIYVCKDSDIVKGCFYNPGNGWNPFYNSRNGLNQDGVPVSEVELPKRKWVRQVVGIGNYCPGTIPVNFIALQSREPGDYHYYLDNIVIRKNDGGIRTVIWQAKADFAPLLYRYKNKNYNSFEQAQAVKGFPFSGVEISATDRF